MATLVSEKAELEQSLSKVETELAVRVEELEQVQSSLATERESGVKVAEALQNQLNEKVTACYSVVAQAHVLVPSGRTPCESGVPVCVCICRRAGSRLWRVS